MMELFSGWSFY